jgi:glycosyltransferase involved in cell wall biosynthesis
VNTAVMAEDASAFDVLFLIGCWEGESKRYRVYNVIEGLERIGCSARALDFSACGEIVDKGLRPRVVVFFRAPFDPAKRIVEVLEYCRINRVRTVFDVDDYVFEPSIIDSIAGVAALSAEQRIDYEWGVRGYRSLLFSCERATTTTRFLQEQMRSLGRDAYIIPNTVNRAQEELAARLRDAPRPVDARLRVCYFSGSKTHSRDFAQCAGALQALMRQDSRIVFRLVGLLDLDESWIPFADRIERAGFMAPLDMLRSLAECDINIAPLEEGDPFCEGKSELKFFEAALVDVPTVASRTEPFRSAITDGETGALASTPDEWLAKLAGLANDAGLRATVGKAARAVALERFTAEAAARAALRAYGLPEPPPRPQPTSSPLTIGWIVPGLIIGGGGHRNILRAAYHLERFGHDVRLYFSDTDLSDDELRAQVRTHFYPFEGKVERFRWRVGGEAILMATHWSTVALAESVRESVGEILYFVQDFEPAFYPMGSDYILAENSYRKGLYAITSGPWCAHILQRDYGMQADAFQFPVDRTVYRPDADGGQPRAKRVLFFAKPEMPRRCFEIGTMALAEFHRLKPDYEILFFGSGSARNYPQRFPVTYLDIVPTLADLARLYATSAAGLVFSTTNPSLVPYEMMACGLPVVDIDRPGNEVNYGGQREIAWLADPDPAKMAHSLAVLLDDPGELALRGARGLAFAQSFPTEEEMARRVETLILARAGRPVVTTQMDAARPATED